MGEGAEMAERVSARKSMRQTRKRMLELKDVWLDIFQGALDRLIDPEHERPAVEVVEDAVEIANAAIDKVEDRWPE